METDLLNKVKITWAQFIHSEQFMETWPLRSEVQELQLGKQLRNIQ